MFYNILSFFMIKFCKLAYNTHIVFITHGYQDMIDFKAQANALYDDLVTQRRDFHRHPELAFQEHRTSQIIAQQLSDLGLEVQTGIAKTGVVGILEGATDGPTIMYRADMDALAIHEANKLDYKSQNEGVMHACAHDGHMTIALGIAKILSQYRDQMVGRVKFIFQPGEEGAGGALAMIDNDILENPEPDYVLGVHIWQPLQMGTVGVRVGAVMSGSSTFTISIAGKSGHAAMPHTTIDPVVCAGQLITALHTIVGRKMDAMAGAVVLSVTGVQTSTYTHNIIPETVEITGTFRTFNAYTSELLEQHVRDVSHNVCESIGCTADVVVKHLNIPTVNDEDVIARAKKRFSRIIDPINLDDEAITMASEDMSFYLDEHPGAYFLLGSSNYKKGLTYGHHHPNFNFDEDVLPLGVALMSSAIADYILPDS
jgi:amidohydrolase